MSTQLPSDSSPQAQVRSSPITRLSANEANTTKRPSAETLGLTLTPLPCTPSLLTLTRSMTFVCRSMTKISVTPLVSPATSVLADDEKAIELPSAEIQGSAWNMICGVLPGDLSSCSETPLTVPIEASMGVGSGPGVGGKSGLPSCVSTRLRLQSPPRMAKSTMPSNPISLNWTRKRLDLCVRLSSTWAIAVSCRMSDGSRTGTGQRVCRVSASRDTVWGLGLGLG